MIKCFACLEEIQEDCICYLEHLKIQHPRIYDIMRIVLSNHNSSLEIVEASLVVVRLQDPEAYEKASKVFCETMQKFWKEFNA